MKRFLKVIDCTQQLQARQNVVGFEKALGIVKVTKDKIQYMPQSLLNLACGYFSISKSQIEILATFYNDIRLDLQTYAKLSISL